MADDPSQKNKLDKPAAEAISINTFTALTAELLAKKAREGKAGYTLCKLGRLLGLALPDLGPRPIASITAPDVLAVRPGRL